jgi:hypothetical protein
MLSRSDLAAKGLNRLFLIFPVEQGIEAQSPIHSLGGRDSGRIRRLRHGAGDVIDFTRASRSLGSALKPFIFALALQQGRLTPADVMDDLPEGAAGISNADRNSLGPLLPRQALANSRNVPAANLLGTLGLDSGFEFFRDLGLHRLDAPEESFGLSMAIGSLPTRLDRLIHAYGALADQGMLRDLAWYGGQPTDSPRRLADSRRSPASNAISVRSVRAASEFSALWHDRISISRSTQDRNLARLPRCLDRGMVASLHGRCLDRPRGFWNHDPGHRRARRRGAGEGDPAAIARRAPG